MRSPHVAPDRSCGVRQSPTEIDVESLCQCGTYWWTMHVTLEATGGLWSPPVTQGPTGRLRPSIWDLMSLPTKFNSNSPWTVIHFFDSKRATDQIWCQPV